MKKIRKIILIGGISVAVLIIVAVIVVALCLDGIVKKGVETVGPQITKVSVNLDSIHIGLLTGSAKVKGLVVGNPEGYKAPSAISIGLAEVGVNPFSILSDKIVVRSIHVESPEITFEGGLNGNNLSKIMDNVNGVAAAGGPPKTDTTAKAASKPAKKIEVDDFLITGAKVHVSLTGVLAKEMTLPLPDIHLTDLGKDSDGLTPTDLTHAILKAITSATVKAVTDSAMDLGKDGGKTMDKLKKGLGGLLGK